MEFGEKSDSGVLFLFEGTEQAKPDCTNNTIQQQVKRSQRERLPSDTKCILKMLFKLR